MTAATPRSWSIPQAAATSPNARCRVRSGSAAVSRAAIAAAISAAVPRYRSETIFGRPSTRAISRRYQYVFPLIFFGYRLDIRLGHTLFRRSGATTDTACHQGKRLRPASDRASKNHDRRKLGLGTDLRLAARVTPLFNERLHCGIVSAA